VIIEVGTTKVRGLLVHRVYQDKKLYVPGPWGNCLASQALKFRIRTLPKIYLAIIKKREDKKKLKKHVWGIGNTYEAGVNLWAFILKFPVLLPSS
jgi:hypothetical protein